MNLSLGTSDPALKEDSTAICHSAVSSVNWPTKSTIGIRPDFLPNPSVLPIPDVDVLSFAGNLLGLVGKQLEELIRRIFT